MIATYLDLALRIVAVAGGLSFVGGVISLAMLALRGYGVKVQLVQMQATINTFEVGLKAQDSTIRDLQDRILHLETENTKLRGKELELSAMRVRVEMLESDIGRKDQVITDLGSKVHTLRGELNVAMGRLSMVGNGSMGSGTTDTVHIATNSVSISEGVES